MLLASESNGTTQAAVLRDDMFAAKGSVGATDRRQGAMNLERNYLHQCDTP